MGRNSNETLSDLKLNAECIYYFKKTFDMRCGELESFLTAGLGRREVELSKDQKEQRIQ